MSDGAFDLQKAIYTTVRAAVSVKVYDHIPQSASLPYVVIGPMRGVSEDDKSAWGTVNTVEIHAFSTGRGFKEVKTILSDIYDALQDATLSVAGQAVDFVRFTDSDYMVDADGVTRRGIHRYDVRMSES